MKFVVSSNPMFENNFYVSSGNGTYARHDGQLFHKMCLTVGNFYTMEGTYFSTKGEAEKLVDKLNNPANAGWE